MANKTAPAQATRRSNKHSHECILEMSTSAVRPPCTSSAFILDSRASSHAVGNVSLFSPSFWYSTTPTTPASNASASDAYQAPDRRVLAVVGTCTVSYSYDNFRIPNVRCVPDLCTTRLNLVSVQQLAECGYLVAFGGGQCFVMEQSSGNVVGKGLLHILQSIGNAGGGVVHS